jgi:Mg2+ and Co2+ transporter CorA
MVPTLIAGIYGMNFDPLLPAGDTPYGFVIVGAIIAITIIWGFVHSRLLGWL